MSADAHPICTLPVGIVMRTLSLLCTKSTWEQSFQGKCATAEQGALSLHPQAFEKGLWCAELLHRFQNTCGFREPAHSAIGTKPASLIRFSEGSVANWKSVKFLTVTQLSVHMFITNKSISLGLEGSLDHLIRLSVDCKILPVFPNYFCIDPNNFGWRKYIL